MEPRVHCIYFLHLLWFLQLEPETFQESSTIAGCQCLGAAVSAQTNLWIQSINGLYKDISHFTSFVLDNRYAAVNIGTCKARSACVFFPTLFAEVSISLHLP